MNTLLCDVIGCHHPAGWKRVVPDHHEEYLCNQHFSLLDGYAPEQSSCYSPMSGVLRGLTAAAESQVQNGTTGEYLEG